MGYTERPGIPVKSKMGSENKMKTQMSQMRRHWKDGSLSMVGLLRRNSVQKSTGSFGLTRHHPAGQ